MEKSISNYDKNEKNYLDSYIKQITYYFINDKMYECFELTKMTEKKILLEEINFITKEEEEF